MFERLRTGIRTMQLNQIDPIILGERLRLARESKQITQAIAAEVIGAARTTLVAIEKGQRKLKIFELKKLADFYNCSVNSFLREEAIHVDLVPRFRKQVTSHSNEGEKAALVMAKLAKAEVELENVLGVRRSRNYPPERPLLPGNVERQAEQDALELRQWLGLAQSPIHDIINILEFDLGVRVYIKKLDANISGLFAYEDSLGACILLNGNHPRDRRNLTAAHELGHLVSTRRIPEVLFDDDPQTSREEKYANAFAKAFLMPSRSLIHKFKEITAGATQFTRRHVIILAHSFGVSREAVVRQLEDLQVIKRGTWDWFSMNGGISNEQAREVLGEAAINNRDQAVAERPTTYRLNSLVCQAWQQALLSEGQLSKLLDIDHHELREILDSHDLDGSDENDAPSLFN